MALRTIAEQTARAYNNVRMQHAEQVSTVSGYESILGDIAARGDMEYYAPAIAGWDNSLAHARRSLCKLTKTKMVLIARQRGIANENGVDFAPEY